MFKRWCEWDINLTLRVSHNNNVSKFFALNDIQVYQEIGFKVWHSAKHMANIFDLLEGIALRVPWVRR